MILTILSLIVGYLTLSVSIALLYAVWLSHPGHTVSGVFLAIAALCSLGFATLSGYLTALVAQRSPLAHTAGLATLLAAGWGIANVVGPSAEPLSLALLNLGIGMVGVMTGGWWRLQQKQ